MPYDVSWMIENKVLFTVYEGHMPIAEFIEANQSKLSFIESSNEAVLHLVADMKTLEHVEPSVSELASVVKVLGHERVEWVIGIGMNQTQYIMLKMLGYVFRKRIYAAKSKSDALYFLQSVDKNLKSSTTFSD